MSKTIDIRSDAEVNVDTIVFADDQRNCMATRIKRYGSTVELENSTGESRSTLNSANVLDFVKALQKAEELGWFK